LESGTDIQVEGKIVYVPAPKEVDDGILRQVYSGDYYALEVANL